MGTHGSDCVMTSDSVGRMSLTDLIAFGPLSHIRRAVRASKSVRATPCSALRAISVVGIGRTPTVL